MELGIRAVVVLTSLRPSGAVLQMSCLVLNVVRLGFDAHLSVCLVNLTTLLRRKCYLCTGLETD